MLSPQNKTKYEQLRRLIDPWSQLGTRTYAAGTLRIGHIPHVAPEAYLHRLGPPLDSAGLRLLQDKLGRPLHPSLSQLLSLHNGIELFHLYIGVDGLRTSYKRSDLDAMVEQPFDLVVPNTWGRPASVPQDVIFICSLGDERDRVAMRPDGSIAICQRDGATLADTPYQDVFDFLLEEAREAEPLYDYQGRRRR